MKLPRRTFLHLAAGAAALPAASRIAWAETYPVRPVHIIVGFPPGGTTDILAGLIGQWLSQRLGQRRETRDCDIEPHQQPDRQRRGCICLGDAFISMR